MQQACVLSCLLVSDFFCDLMDYSPPSSSVHWIFQARILEWVAISSSGGFSDPGFLVSIGVAEDATGKW